MIAIFVVVAAVLGYGVIGAHRVEVKTYTVASPDLPAELRSELAKADLVILKGDANYRRLLHDRHWPHTARLEELAAYFPAPLACLRTLKSELAVDLTAAQVAALDAADPHWLINGRRGIIRYLPLGAPLPAQSP